MLGVLISLHIATSAVTLADQPTQIINEYNVRGVPDVTVLLPSAYNPPDPTKCTLTIANERSYAKAWAYSGRILLSYTPACTAVDIRQWEMTQAQYVRTRLGDKGRH